MLKEFIEEGWGEHVARYHLARAQASERAQARFHIGAAVKAWPDIRMEILEDDELERFFWSVCGE